MHGDESIYTRTQYSRLRSRVVIMCVVVYIDNFNLKKRTKNDPTECRDSDFETFLSS